MYQIVEIKMATVSRLYGYHLREAFGADFSLKGFDRPWLVSAHDWRPGERVLDVGAAYSKTPIHLQETYGLEMWVADDFGLGSDEPFWQRGRSPQEHAAAHPGVKFVLERLGGATSSLPEGYFDVIYSLSALEHVPAAMTPAVWAHMDRLLKPGGELIHAIDMPFPSNTGLRGLIKAAGFDLLFPLLPTALRLRYHLATPRGYLDLGLRCLGVGAPRLPGLSPLRLALDPDVLTESYAHGLNRIRKDGMAHYRYTRTGSLLVHLKKTG